MRAIPTGFPHRLSDDELEHIIDTMLSSPVVASQPFVSILPELQLAIVIAGIQEKGRRAADRAERQALCVAVAAFVVSLVSVLRADGPIVVLKAAALGRCGMAAGLGWDELEGEISLVERIRAGSWARRPLRPKHELAPLNFCDLAFLVLPVAADKPHADKQLKDFLGCFGHRQGLQLHLLRRPKLLGFLTEDGASCGPSADPRPRSRLSPVADRATDEAADSRVVGQRDPREGRPEACFVSVLQRCGEVFVAFRVCADLQQAIS